MQKWGILFCKKHYDNIPWVRENLKTSLPIYFIEHNDVNKSYEDLRLMSRCKHHIIANSSFSWWGAWLSDNSKKIVIAPKLWFAKENIKTDDIYVNGWVKL